MGRIDNIDSHLLVAHLFSSFPFQYTSRWPVPVSPGSDSRRNSYEVQYKYRTLQVWLGTFSERIHFKTYCQTYQIVYLEFSLITMPPIKGQSVVIIGGSSGIGAAAAKLACAEGLKVAIASSNQGRVGEAVKKIQDAVPGAQVSGFTVDISGNDMESHLEKLLTDVTEANGGPIDHIILTAGLANVKPISEFTAEYFKEAAPLYDIS